MYTSFQHRVPFKQSILYSFRCVNDTYLWWCRSQTWPHPCHCGPRRRRCWFGSDLKEPHKCVNQEAPTTPLPRGPEVSNTPTREKGWEKYIISNKSELELRLRGFEFHRFMQVLTALCEEEAQLVSMCVWHIQCNRMFLNIQEIEKKFLHQCKTTKCIHYLGIQLCAALLSATVKYVVTCQEHQSVKVQIRLLQFPNATLSLSVALRLAWGFAAATRAVRPRLTRGTV